MKLLTKILGDPNAREVKRLEPSIRQINGLEPEFEKLSDGELLAKTGEFKARLEKGEALDKLLPEAFAVVRETARRVLGMRHFDVQLVGGMIMHQGKIAEMRTGEGKTLVATLPLYLNALTGRGVHLVTVNDYLARIGVGWMGPVYHALGLSTGVIVHDTAMLYDPDYTDDTHGDERLRHLRPVPRREAYAADIIYGTNNEYGFDYLRDNMVDDVHKMVQRPLNYAIVDEVDSILIDEARTPLIISAPAEESTDKYHHFAKLARRLTPGTDYTVDEKLKAVSLTDEGIAALEQALGVDNIYESHGIEDVHHIEQSLKAEALFKRDRDYVVREGEVIIVDEFTGRLMPGRRYSEGLHQAIEAKEGVEVRQESLTLATITFQNYFRLYRKLAGMTGTAATESEEFGKIYNLDVTEIPTHQPMIRQDRPDKIYKTELGKFRAVAREVKECHDRGQPVLLGTVSIQKNELLSEVLSSMKVPHQVLNAKNNEAEAGIVAAAGRKGAVTLATNIAGRGTDIVLEEGVAELGGLHVAGTERHESRRIDNQLRGRSGRQGDPGSSQFYVSLEDDLMRIFGSERIAGLMTTLGLDEDTPIENPIVSKSLESAQKKVEGHNFDIRKQLVEYDDVMNKHRTAVYSRRRKALENQNLRPEILEMTQREIQAIIKAHTDTRTGVVELDKIIEAAGGVMPLDEATLRRLQEAHTADIADLLSARAEAVYDERVAQFGEDGMRLIERLTYLRVLDNLWIEHLDAMDNLRSGIGLRAIGQRDPLVEYKSEGFRMFKNLIAVLEAEIASTIFKMSISRVEEAPVETALTRAAEKAALSAPGQEPAQQRPVRRRQPVAVGAAAGQTAGGGSATDGSLPHTRKVGRNDPCPCGSGKKYKRCHGA
ncbi:preprotein translocase subunit SecA [Candidatus Parcubacteria bacterium]|nr:preprotein translocase subunit SecA [Candidatus Parcubacteria bacterium]